MIEAASQRRPHLTVEALAKCGPTGAPNFGLTGLVNSEITSNYGSSIVLSYLLKDSGRTLHLSRSREHSGCRRRTPTKRDSACGWLSGCIRPTAMHNLANAWWGSDAGRGGPCRHRQAGERRLSGRPGLSRRPAAGRGRAG